MIAVATLLVTSVKAAVNVLNTKMRIHGGSAWKLTKKSPITSDNPDICAATIHEGTVY